VALIRPFQRSTTLDPRVAAAARGDRGAFGELYRAHVDRIHGLCHRLTGDRALAEDCTQEAFIAAWRALPSFEGRAQFGSWLFRIAANVALARVRAPAKQREMSSMAMSDDDGGAGVDDAPPIDVEAAIARLPDGARQVLVLVGLYGFTHEEAAADLGIAIGTSKAQLHRARRLLSTWLGLEEQT
jgi:RNA polymerase sigma-70 factor (ECF subfamily)